MLRALATALLKSVRRDFAGFASIRTNNFFLFVALLIYGAMESGVAPIASYPFLFALAVLMVFPAFSALTNKIPRVRRQLWPLNPALRAALLAFAGKPRALPHLPAIPVRFGGLLANNLRQLFSLLDTWLALAIGIVGRLAHPDPAAYPVLSLLAALALSTSVQSPFALDGDSGLTRYRLLPMRGWQILLAKDAAWLAILLLAVLPLAVVPGLTFGLTSLAVARYPALRLHLPQERWRFTSGRVLWGVSQCILAGMLGFAGALLPSLALYVLSLLAPPVSSPRIPPRLRVSASKLSRSCYHRLMAKFKPVRMKPKSAGPPQGAVGCVVLILLLLVGGMLFLYLVMRSHAT